MSNLSERKIRVIIADDHEIFREGMAAVLNKESEIEIVGSASDGPELEALVEKFPCDVVVSDHVMPTRSGLSAIIEIKRRYPNIKGVLLTVVDDARLRRLAQENNIDRYLMKSEVKDRIVEAIKEVHHGLGQSQANHVTFPGMGKHEGADSANPLDQLSARECEVLRSLAEGKTYRDTAEILGISVKTVEFHRKNISDKLGKKSTPELTRLALTWGLLRDDELISIHAG